MTLVQVKRPDRRLDTAEVIPTVTREVDDEGVMKAYRGDDAPTREKDLVRRQEDRQPRIRPPPARSPRVRNDARRQGHDNNAAAARARRRSYQLEALAGDWSRPLGKEAMSAK
ncbi:hypothetical protein ACWD7C_03715 [Streptomyces sp. NPDC005134]|uniref:hypothetical protein n=1 Tax=unclassified Streptomyces TaxID=2593676 RepID=UPI0033BA5C70